MNPGGGLALIILAVAGLLGGGVAWRWLSALSRLLPPPVLALHVAAGPFMVLGTIPAFLAWWAWRGRIGAGSPATGGAAGGGVGWDVLVMAGAGGMLWLAGLWCLLAGHRRFAAERGDLSSRGSVDDPGMMSGS